MTYAPQRLLDVRHYLQPIIGLQDFELGIVGDAAHLGGYHHGWDQRRKAGDYSWSESTRDSSHKTNAARAFDLGMFPQLREFSIWLVNECRYNVEDTLDIREIIYSPDGKTVARWDRLGKRTSGDNSHLTHTHISFFADAEDRDKTGPFKRFFGDDMEQKEKLAYPTRNSADRTVGQALTEMSELRDGMLGVGDFAAGAPGVYPLKGSPAWNLKNLPELLKQNSGGMTDAQVDQLAAKIVAGLTPAIQALPKPPTAKEIADLLATRLAQ